MVKEMVQQHESSLIRRSSDTIDLPRSENVDQALLVSRDVIQKMIDDSKERRLQLFFVEGSGSACIRISKFLKLRSGVSANVGTDLIEAYTNSRLDGCKGIDTNIVICTPQHLLRRMFNAPKGERRPFCQIVVMNSGYCKKEEVDALLNCFPFFGVSDVRHIRWLPRVLQVNDTSVDAGTSPIASFVVSSINRMDKKLGSSDPRPFLVFTSTEVLSSLEKLPHLTVIKTTSMADASKKAETSRSGKRVVFVATGGITFVLPSISAVFDTGMEIITRAGMDSSFPVKVSQWTTDMRRSFSEREYVSIASRGQRAAFAPEDPKMALGMRVISGQPPLLTEQEILFNALPFGTTMKASEGLHEWMKRGLPPFLGVCASVSKISGKPISTLLKGMTKENWRFFSWGCHETRLIGAICNSLIEMKHNIIVSGDIEADIIMDLWEKCKPEAKMIFFGLPEDKTLIWDSSWIME